jgi:hypothetical protein
MVPEVNSIFFSNRELEQKIILTQQKKLDIGNVSKKKDFNHEFNNIFI